MSGSAVKNHGWPKRGRLLYAKSTFQGYPPILGAIRRQHRHRRIWYLMILFLRRRSILREERNLGSKHTVKFSKGTWHQSKIRERKGPSRGIFPKCAPHDRGPCAPTFGERSQEETLHQERSQRGTWRKHLQAEESGQNYVLYSLYTPIEAKVLPAPTLTRPEEREFVVVSGASTHKINKKNQAQQKVILLKCVLPPSWRPRSAPLRATSEVARANHDGCVAFPLAATASPRARHVHGDPDCLVSVRFGTHDGHCD